MQARTILQVCEDVEQEQECATVEEVIKLNNLSYFPLYSLYHMVFKISVDYLIKLFCRTDAM